MSKTAIIVEILQNALINQLKSESKFNPQHVANAIEEKIKFGQSAEEKFNREILDTIIEAIETSKTENEQSFEQLNPEAEKLLRNFIRGKIHAYDEVLDILKKL